MTYKPIASYYSRLGRLHLWLCAQACRRLPVHRLWWGGKRSQAVWLYFYGRAYTWGEIEIERRYFPNAAQHSRR